MKGRKGSILMVNKNIFAETFGKFSFVKRSPLLRESVKMCQIPAKIATFAPPQGNGIKCVAWVMRQTSPT